MSPILQGLANGSARGYGAFVPLGAAGPFQSIASASGTGSSNEITFSSIPSAYQHLQIRGIMQWASGDELRIRMNGGTNLNYASHHLMGDGSAVIVSGLANQSQILVSASGYSWQTATYPAPIIVDIHDYASTTKKKTVRVFMGVDQNTTPRRILLSSGLWNSTSAITSLTFRTDANNFATTTSLGLYGIQGA